MGLQRVRAGVKMVEISSDEYRVLKGKAERWDKFLKFIMKDYEELSKLLDNNQKLHISKSRSTLTRS